MRPSLLREDAGSLHPRREGEGARANIKAGFA